MIKSDIIGQLQFYNSDNIEIMKQYPDKYFDLAIVDPPFGIDINSSGRLGHYGGKGKKWDSLLPTDDYFNELFRISKNQIVWGGNYFKLPPTRCFLIWDKQQPEDVSFASCEFAWTSFDQSAKTFYKRPQSADNKRIHPTQKPVDLYDWILKRYAKPNDCILDSNLGSGSIAIAIEKANKLDNMNLSFVGIELDTEYYDAALNRFKQFYKQTTIIF